MMITTQVVVKCLIVNNFNKNGFLSRRNRLRNRQRKLNRIHLRLIILRKSSQFHINPKIRIKKDIIIRHKKPHIEAEEKQEEAEVNINSLMNKEVEEVEDTIKTINIMKISSIKTKKIFSRKEKLKGNNLSPVHNCLTNIKI